MEEHFFLYLHNHYGKHYRGFSKKLKLETLYDPATPFLGMNQQKMKTLI